MNGSWPIYVGFLSISAHIRRVFIVFFFFFRRVFAGHVGPFTSGFCRVFVGFYWACGAYLRRFLAGFL